MQFTLFSVPVRVNPYFWLIVLLIVLLNASTLASMLVWGCVVFVSVLIHEMGHALTAKAFGQQAQIELYGLGGVTKRRGGRHLSEWKEFLIVLNGPMAGLLLAAVSFSLLKSTQNGSIVQLAFYVAALVNFFWTVLNLLPVQPLDGGQLVRILLQGFFGITGLKISIWLSLLIAISVGLFAFSIGQFFVGILFMMLTFENFRVIQSLKGVTPNDQDLQLQKMLMQAEKAEQAGDREHAIGILQKVREKTKTGLIYHTATEDLAALYAGNGRTEEAYQLLAPLQAALSPAGMHLFFSLAKQLNHFTQAIQVGNQLYQIDPCWEMALEMAECHAELKQVTPAVGWFDRAVHDGLPHIKEALASRSFDTIRQEAAFQKY